MPTRARRVEPVETKPTQLRCRQCRYRWRQRGKERPKECPQCKSRYWDRKE